MSTQPLEMSFTPQFSDQKDIERAQGIVKILNVKGLDSAMGAANKMAKLITDVDKLLRRTEAVICEDVRLAEPFITRAIELTQHGYNTSGSILKQMATAYQEGKIVGRYCPGLPKEHTGRQCEKASFLAGFASSYGYRNYLTLKTANKFGI